MREFPHGPFLMSAIGFRQKLSRPYQNPKLIIETSDKTVFRLLSKCQISPRIEPIFKLVSFNFRLYYNPVSYSGVVQDARLIEVLDNRLWLEM